MSISRPIAGDRCGFCGTAAAGDHDVGLAAAVSAATYEQQKEQAVRSLLPPNTTFSAVAFDVFGSSVGRGVAEEDGGPIGCTALRRDFGSDGVAAFVVRDGDRLDGRGSGGDAPAVAGARGRLVA